MSNNEEINYLSNPHAEAMKLWAEDHSVLPPRHKWEYKLPNGGWEPATAPPMWMHDTLYRRAK